MPPTWGASGKRLAFDVVIHLAPDGAVEPLEVDAPWVDVSCGRGRWQADGGPYPKPATLRMEVPMGGCSKHDVELPAGPLYFSVPAFGGLLSQSKGILTVRQKRWGIREESRIVGTFAAERIEEDGGDGVT
ncbi:unnamed protein product [Phaeothamnion confervicola]